MSLKSYAVLAALSLAACNNPPTPPDDEEPLPPPPPQCVPWTSSSEGLMLGTQMSDEVLDLLVDSKGNLYAAGYENGTTGQQNIDPSGDSRGFLAKVHRAEDGSMQLAWSQSVNTSSTDVIEALALHPKTGELYFTGRTRGTFPGFTNRGQFDTIVGWSVAPNPPKVFFQGGKETPQHPRNIAFDGSGDIIISGYDDVYVPSNYVAAWEDPFVLKLRQEGGGLKQIWYNQFSTPQTDLLNGMAVNPLDNSIYISGASQGGSQRGMYVTKLDAAGGQLWSHWPTSIGVDMVQSVHVLPDGKVLIAGSTFAMLGERAYGQQDVVVRLLDPSTGTPLWTKQYGSDDSDWVTDMTVGADGSIYIVGETFGSVESGIPNRGDIDIFMLKLDASGNLLHSKQWGTDVDERPSTVAVDACGRVFIGGYTSGHLLGTNSGRRDGLVLTWLPPTPAPTSDAPPAELQ